jgi:hypothetical protein
MAFGNKKPAPVPLTVAQKITRYQTMAEAELARANKAGRLDAQTVHAARATAAATLALTLIMGESDDGVSVGEIEEPSDLT